MSQRKLQQEIDRVFKKVKEGLEEFDFIYDKLQSSESQSQKEKLENDLKREIKKLQRSREQIKNWMSGNEVKDKKQLIEHRKLIEVEMERFKEVEKIMKTKAFSKEGLSQHKMDPKEKEKLECANFVQSMIEELERQNEALEAQVDQLSGTIKKGKKSDSSKQAQVAEFQELLNRHNWHIDKLENILRLLENGNIDVEQVNTIQEDIQYYVESNQDDNFIEDDTFYDELGLDELDDSFRFAAANINVDDEDDDIGSDENESSVPPLSAASLPAASASASTHKSLNRQPSMPIMNSSPALTDTTIRKVSLPIQATSSTSSLNATGNTDPENALNGASISSLRMSSTGSQTPIAASVLTGNLKPATPVTTPKLKYASVAAVAAAAAAAAASTSTSNIGSVTSNGNTNTSASTVIHGSPIPIAQSTTSANVQSNVTTAPITANSSPAPSAPPGLSRVSTTLSTDNNGRESTQSPVNGIVKLLDATTLKNLPKGFDKYACALDSAYERLEAKQPPTMPSIFPYLESSLLNCPDSYDSDIPINYVPVNPWPNHASFPQEPAAEIIGSTKLLHKLELRTLFYCFYYHNYRYKSSQCGYSTYNSSIHKADGDYLQFIAAKELNKRGWKYHKGLSTWFIEVVEGDSMIWKYFDFNSSWTIIKKEGFTFDPEQEERLFL